jgi:hypothetical protein
VLYREVSTAQVMHDQLRHVLMLMECDNVEIRVLPTRIYAPAGNVTEFTLLNFEEAQSVGYVEYHTGALYVQDYDGVAVFETMAGQFSSAALSPTESAKLIRKRAAEWKRGDEHERSRP